MDRISKYLADHRFADLFRDELGWDRATGTMVFSFDERQLRFEAIAQKRGLQVLLCTADRRVLFNRGLLRQAQRKVARVFHEHILIYACREPPKQVWQWAVRLKDGRQFRHREHSFFSSVPPGRFVDRLGRLRFSLEDEANVTLVEALARVRAALDVSADMDLFARHPRCAEQSDQLAIAMRNGDPDAFHKFVVFHRPLARHISERVCRWLAIDEDEAEQIGVIGLIEAARRFDPERGYQFSTYASYWVRQSCQRFGPEAALFIRLPCHIIQRFFSYQRRLDLLTLEFGPARSRDALFSRCQADDGFLERWRGFERALNVRSLSDRSEPEYRQARRLPATPPVPPDQELRDEKAAIVRAAIDELKPRDQRCIRWRHGIDGELKSLAEIGAVERISPSRVQQIVKKAERRLGRLLYRKLGFTDPSTLSDTHADSGIATNGDPQSFL